MSRAVILSISLLVFLMPLLNAKEWSDMESSKFKRQSRQENPGWSWNYVDAFGSTTYNTQDRQELNKPRESISILQEEINVFHKLKQDFFSKILNVFEVFINNALTKSINVAPEKLNFSLEVVNISKTSVNLSPEALNMSQEIVNLSPETMNISSETVFVSPKPISDSQESINVSQRIQPVVETPITKTSNEQQVVTETPDTSFILSEKLISETNETTTEENPCKRPDPEVPDFSAPGRRISEIKCYEYIWEMKKRLLKNQRNLDCIAYLNKLGYGAGFYGEIAKDGEYPHMGAIGWTSSQGKDWEFKCGGTLISPKFLLTAGHCTSASKQDTTIADPVPKIVRLHDTRITNDGGIKEDDYGSNKIDVNISRIIPHPQYKSPMKYYDVALMELEKEMKFDKYMQPACLWTKTDTSSLGIGATATGWGVTEKSRVPSPVLIAVKVKFVNYQQCDNLLTPLRNRHFRGLEDHQLCAGNLEGGADACQGDSGGPLQVQIPLPDMEQGVMHYVVGVTSFGYGCGLANKPGVYTRVSSFVDWIENIVWR